MRQRVLFDRYIGIDYSGAQTPTASLKGLRVYVADPESMPIEIQPPPGPKKYWTQRGIALWLADRLSEDRRTVVGIDHGFSFPIQLSSPTTRSPSSFLALRWLEDPG